MLDSQGSLFFNASRMARERQERSTRDGTKALTVRSTTQCLGLLRSNVSFGLKRENDMDALEVSKVSAMFSAPVWLGQIILCLRTWRK